MKLRRTDAGPKGLKGKNPVLRLVLLKVADRVIRSVFQTYAKLIGLYGYHLPDMDEIAQVAHRHYNNHLRGGEGHMEVGKLILNVIKRKVNMTISVKPFGCMPSSGVSDGVQSLITAIHPEANFLPLETTGDRAINFYSRVQMKLFKAKQDAQIEFDEALAQRGYTVEQLRKRIVGRMRLTNSLKRSHHVVACTSANVVYGTVYHKPMEHLMQHYLPGRAENLTGATFDDLQRKLQNGKPVVVWTTVHFSPPRRWDTWLNNGEQIRATREEHAVLLVGYDPHYVYVNDPLTGRKAQQVDKSSFLASWTSLGRQALTYR